MSRISPTSPARLQPSAMSGRFTPYGDEKMPLTPYANTLNLPARSDKTASSSVKLPNPKVKRRIKTTFYRIPRRVNSADEADRPNGLWDRVLQTFLVTVIYAVLGFLIDGLIYVVKAMVSVGSVQVFWLFLPLLAGLGVILGWLLGGRALDALLIPFQMRDNPTFDEASFGYGMMRALGIGLILAVIGWLLLMMFS